MFKTDFLLLLAAHVLGDYLFQSGGLARRKRNERGSLLVHCLLYTAACALMALLVYSAPFAVGFAVLAAGHLVIDAVKFRCTRGRSADTPEGERRIYIIDQLAHLFLTAVIAFALAAGRYAAGGLPLLRTVLQIVQLPASVAFSWGLMLLLVGKPANITIKKLIYKPETGEDEPVGEKTMKAGGFIGLLERLIILIFLSIQQYSAIGLVLTAKSIARYDKISKDRSFAEYYLLGTLLSTLFVIVTWVFIG